MHKEPIPIDKEIIKGKKKKKKTVKKSKHKHEYVYYIERVGVEDYDTYTLEKVGICHSMVHSGWRIHHMCEICGKDKGDVYLWISEKGFNEAMTNGTDITAYKG